MRAALWVVVVGRGGVSRYYSSLLAVFSLFVGSVAAGNNDMSVFYRVWVRPQRLSRRFRKRRSRAGHRFNRFRSDPLLRKKKNRDLIFLPANTQALSLECVWPPPPPPSPSCKRHLASSGGGEGGFWGAGFANLCA